MALGGAVCHTIYSFAQTALLEHVYCNELLVLFKDSGSCSTINTGPSTETPVGYPVVALSHGVLVAIIPRDLHTFQQVLHWVDV